MGRNEYFVLKDNKYFYKEFDIIFQSYYKGILNYNK